MKRYINIQKRLRRDRNYADCLQLKLEIEKDGDSKAIEILENRLKLIQKDIDNKKYWQH